MGRDHLRRMLVARDRGGLLEYLRKEPLEDIQEVDQQLQHLADGDSQATLGEALASFSDRSFSSLLQQRPELQPIAQDAMRRDLQRRIAFAADAPSGGGSSQGCIPCA